MTFQEAINEARRRNADHDILLDPVGKKHLMVGPKATLVMINKLGMTKVGEFRVKPARKKKVKA